MDRTSNDSLLVKAVGSIGHATTLDDAFQALVEVLRQPLQLWHASLWSHDLDEGVGEVVAAWSLADSAFEMGTKVAWTISDTAWTAVQALERGEVVAGNAPVGSGLLVDALFSEQGVNAGLAVPIQRDAHEMLVLLLGAPTDEPLLSRGGAFYRTLAAGIHARFAELLAQRTI
jgi:hypothetical protein